MNLFDKETLLQRAAEQFESQDPAALLRWAKGTFPNIVLACSFGAEDVVLVDLVWREHPTFDVFYLDTDLHFRQTYETRSRLEERYGRSFVRVQPQLTLAQQAEQFGEGLWTREPNACCNIRKVDPLTTILGKYDAWVTGIRRDQAPTRANARKAEYDTKFGIAKFNPLADWTSDDVWAYIREHNLPYNPLHDQGYPSIGCEPCTRQVLPGEDPRAGRWSGSEKTECGLHPSS